MTLYLIPFHEVPQFHSSFFPFPGLSRQEIDTVESICHDSSFLQAIWRILFLILFQLRYMKGHVPLLVVTKNQSAITMRSRENDRQTRSSFLATTLVFKCIAFSHRVSRQNDNFENNIM